MDILYLAKELILGDSPPFQHFCSVDLSLLTDLTVSLLRDMIVEHSRIDERNGFFIVFFPRLSCLDVSYETIREKLEHDSPKPKGSPGFFLLNLIASGEAPGMIQMTKMDDIDRNTRIFKETVIDGQTLANRLIGLLRVMALPGTFIGEMVFGALSEDRMNSFYLSICTGQMVTGGSLPKSFPKLPPYSILQRRVLEFFLRSLQNETFEIPNSLGWIRGFGSVKTKAEAYRYILMASGMPRRMTNHERYARNLLGLAFGPNTVLELEETLSAMTKIAPLVDLLPKNMVTDLASFLKTSAETIHNFIGAYVLLLVPEKSVMPFVVLRMADVETRTRILVRLFLGNRGYRTKHMTDATAFIDGCPINVDDLTDFATNVVRLDATLSDMKKKGIDVWMLPFKQPRFLLHFLDRAVNHSEIGPMYWAFLSQFFVKMPSANLDLAEIIILKFLELNQDVSEYPEALPHYIRAVLHLDINEGTPVLILDYQESVLKKYSKHSANRYPPLPVLLTVSGFESFFQQIRGNSQNSIEDRMHAFMRMLSAPENAGKIPSGIPHQFILGDDPIVAIDSLVVFFRTSRGTTLPLEVQEELSRRCLQIHSSTDDPAVKLQKFAALATSKE